MNLGRQRNVSSINFHQKKDLLMRRRVVVGLLIESFEFHKTSINSVPAAIKCMTEPCDHCKKLASFMLVVHSDFCGKIIYGKIIYLQ